VVGVVVLLLVAAGGTVIALAGGGDDDGEDAAPATTSTTADEEAADDGADASDEEAEQGDGDAEDQDVLEDPGFDGAATVRSTDLQVGHCIEEDLDFLVLGIGDLTLVDCATPHRAEVYHRFDAFDGPWPGDAAVDQMGVDACYGTAFSDYVGSSYAASSLYASYVIPTEQTWGQGDRTIMCFAHEEDPSVTSTVSVRNSGR
jgi:hypothetical protein